MEAAAFDVAQQCVKIFFYLVIPDHVLDGLVVIDVVVVLFSFIGIILSYSLPPHQLKAIAGR